MTLRRRHALSYSALAAASAFLGLALSSTPIAWQLNDNIYDFIFRLRPSPRPSAEGVVVGFDEDSFRYHGGTRALRSTLAAALLRIAPLQPKVVAVDLTLTDPGDPSEDAALANAFSKTPGLVLACEMPHVGSAWQDPVPAFRQHAKAVGHVHALAGPSDNINRRITLERAVGIDRRWALSLEAFRLARNAQFIEASPNDILVANLSIPARQDHGSPLRVHYRPSDRIPFVSIHDILEGRHLDTLRHKVIFIGETAQSAMRDRLFTPLSGGVPTPGVEIHEQAFETLAAADFLTDANALWPFCLSILAAFLVAALFAFTPPWLAYPGGLVTLLASHGLPYLLFGYGTILPAFPLMVAAWFSLLACAAFQFFHVRRQLQTSEAATARYQQAFHFVAHEMRTPLTAIQGSSELMTRYNLPEPKRKELGHMINAESKRLAKMITTFLDVEKLTAGQMELRRSNFPLQELVDTCYQRALPLADRKQIRVSSEVPDDFTLNADRELLEYALYNLLTNAIKYSAPDTEVLVGAAHDGAQNRLWVRDQGMGMDEHEVKNLFRKFYRTRRAEQSGEIGTGIGLSIVHQIVHHHGGRIEVTSAPGKGSTFIVFLPATLH